MNGMVSVRQHPSCGRHTMSNIAVPVRVLIVDDNTDLADSMGRLLEHHGFDVLTAAFGRRGLETARSFRPRVVLLDIDLPDMDGYQVAANLRQDPGLDNVLLIGVSAYERDPRFTGEREARFDHYLIKPVELDQLLALLADVEPFDT